MLSAQELKVAEFWFSFGGKIQWDFDEARPNLDYDSFLKKNSRLIRKIAAYGEDKWSDIISETGDLLDALIILNIKFGPIARTDTFPSTNERRGLLGVWERKWGELPRKYKIGFVRNPKFKSFINIDIEILVELFQQHRKFDSVIAHINAFKYEHSSYDWELLDFSPTTPLGFLESIENEIFTQNASNKELLNSDFLEDFIGGLDINDDWNIDDLDSETIIFGPNSGQYEF